MALERISIDRKDIPWFAKLKDKGRLNLQPNYQREAVWTDDKKFALIDSIFEQFPIGLIILNVSKVLDADGHSIDHYDTVDGQQRLTTILEYFKGEAKWASTLRKDIGFTPFNQLTEARQEHFESAQLPIACLYEFTEEETSECFSRLQFGKPLSIGEKLKALTTSPAYEFVKSLAEHPIFNLDSRLSTRGNQWTLACSFMKSAYSNNALARVESNLLRDFMKSDIDPKQAKKAIDEARRTLNLILKVINEARALNPNSNFKNNYNTARTLKWLFAIFLSLGKTYGISGKETGFARCINEYYDQIANEGSTEWAMYMNTGRSGRIDTDDVKNCLAELSNQMINKLELNALDNRRLFTIDQRRQIFERSQSKCSECGTEISPSNFHADHIKPFSIGGRTDVANGQALCTDCNRKKGNMWQQIFSLAK